MSHEAARPASDPVSRDERGVPLGALRPGPFARNRAGLAVAGGDHRATPRRDTPAGRRFRNVARNRTRKRRVSARGFETEAAGGHNDFVRNV